MTLDHICTYCNDIFEVEEGLAIFHFYFVYEYGEDCLYVNVEVPRKMCPGTECKEENRQFHPSEWYLSKLQLDESACRDAAADFLT